LSSKRIEKTGEGKRKKKPQPEILIESGRLTTGGKCRSNGETRKVRKRDRIH